jgi:hypothetical protein
MPDEKITFKKKQIIFIAALIIVMAIVLLSL